MGLCFLLSRFTLEFCICTGVGTAQHYFTVARSICRNTALLTRSHLAINTVLIRSVLYSNTAYSIQHRGRTGANYASADRYRCCCTVQNTSQSTQQKQVRGIVVRRSTGTCMLLLYSSRSTRYKVLRTYTYKRNRAVLYGMCVWLVGA